MVLNKIIIISIILVSLLLLSSCATVTSIYTYTNTDKESSWKRADIDEFHTFINQNKVSMEINGKYGDISFGGPLFIPAIPVRERGFTAVISCDDCEGLFWVENLHIELDDKIKYDLKPDSNSRSDRLSFSIQKLNFFPDIIKIQFNNASMWQKQIEIPPIHLSTDKEKCYSYGDSITHYVGCDSKK